MKKRILIGISALVGVLGLASLALADIVPAGCVILCKRGVESVGNVTNTVFYQGDYITLTNSVMYSDSGATTQNLQGCTIRVSAGSTSTTNPVVTAGYLMDTNNGTWGVEFVVPAVNPCYIEIGVSNVYNFTYPRYRIQTQTKLGNP